METTETDFAIDLYIEHLEEASFLYEHRLTLMTNPEIAWTTIADIEERLEAHIDGLMIGGELALEHCVKHATEGEPGELYTATCVFCRQDRKDLVQKVIDVIDPEDEECLQAIGDALKYEMPDQWSDEFIRWAAEKETHAAFLAARLVGYKNLPLGPMLLNFLPGKNSKETSEILWALGRLRCLESRPMLVDNYISSQDESICTCASQALLMLGEPQAWQHCLQSAKLQDWPNKLIGISADRSAVSILLKKAANENATSSSLFGLGLLGDISAVETLVGSLSDPETAESAALALNLITGANIYEDAFIQDEINEDDLLPDELEKFRQGQVPTRSDGKPYGVTITRLSQKPEDWRNWWTRNRSRFKNGIRYRNGKLFSPACLLENIENKKSPYNIRQLAYEEMAIRYGMHFPFEADMPVVRQKHAIKDITRWVAANENRFQPGTWYFCGKPLT